MTQIKLKGGKELSAYLAAFPAKLVKGAVRSALTHSARPIRDQARLNAPRATGQFAKAIKTGSPKVGRDGTASVRVYVDRKKPHGYLGHWLEYGVSAHAITAGDSDLKPRQLNKQIKRDGVREGDDGALIIGNNFIRGAVMHPGFPPKPYLRPALDTRAEDAVNAFGEQLRTYMKSKTGFTLPLLETDND